MSLGPMSRCRHCGVLSVDEALACEEGDCAITDWYVPIKKRKRRKAGNKKSHSAKRADRIILCAGCDQNIRECDGSRIYASGNLYCRKCHDSHSAVAADLKRSHWMDEQRDSFNETRR